MAKKTTELVLHFYKNITKLVFLLHNMGQKGSTKLSYLSNKNYLMFYEIEIENASNC